MIVPIGSPLAEQIRTQSGKKDNEKKQTKEESEH
jgi:hypothetical protein